MDRNLKQIFGLSEPLTTMRQQDMVIDDAPSGRALRHRMIKLDPWLRKDDLRDAVMTFCLTFVGGMMFLID